MRGLQIINCNHGFGLVFRTDHADLNILEEKPPKGYTPLVWDALRRRNISQAQNWLRSEEEEGYGLIVFEGTVFEFDTHHRVKVEDWPVTARAALVWLKNQLEHELT